MTRVISWNGFYGLLGLLLLLISSAENLGATPSTPTVPGQSPPQTLQAESPKVPLAATPGRADVRTGDSTAPVSHTTPHFLFAAPEQQGEIGPRGQQVRLELVDLAIPGSGLDLRRSYGLSRLGSGGLGSLWRSNWDGQLIVTEGAVFIEDHRGCTVFRETDPAGASFVSPGGQRLERDRDDFLRTFPDGTTERFSGDGQRIGQLVERTSRSGERFQVVRDPDGSWTRIEGPRQASLLLEWNADGQIVRASSSPDLIVYYSYRSGLLVRVAGTFGSPVEYDYDAAASLCEIRHAAFGRVRFNYDEQGRVVSRSWSDGTVEQWEYDPNAPIVRYTDAEGSTTSIELLADGSEEQVIDSLGNRVVLQYDRQGRMKRVTDPVGHVGSFDYDQLGRLIATHRDGRATSIQYRGNSSRPESLNVGGMPLQFEYDSNGRVVRVDAAGHSTLIGYGQDGKPNSIVGPSGASYALEHNPRGLVSSVADPLGRTTSWRYDRQGRVTEQIDAAGGVERWTYGSSGLVESRTDPVGGMDLFEYHPGGLLARWTNPLGAITEYGYDGLRQWVTDPLGRTTQATFNRRGQRATEVDAAGNTTSYEYDAAGNLVRQIDSSGGITRATYDTQGRVIQLEDPVGGKTHLTYASTGGLAVLRSPDGQVTRFTYDEHGDLVSMQNSNGKVAYFTPTPAGPRVRELRQPGCPPLSFHYDAQGNLLESRDGQQLLERHEYDAAGQLIRTYHASGLTTTYRYDDLGRLVQWQDDLGSGEQTAWDAVGRPTKVTDSRGAQAGFSYDLAGNLIEMRSPLGDRTRYAYNSAGELIRVVNPSGQSAEYGYDANGHLVRIQLGRGDPIRFQFDSLGNRTQWLHASGEGTSRVYDLGGRLTSETDAEGRQTSYSYDSLGRLTERHLANGARVTYQYDAQGNLREVDDGTFPVRFSYDQAGRLIEREYPALHRSLRWEYDAQTGRVSRFTDSEGQVREYRYDEASRLTEISLGSNQRFELAYDARDRLVSLRYPNGTVGQWTYDSEDRPLTTVYRDAAGEVRQRIEYQYDSAGRPVSLLVDEQASVTYHYDSAGQLIEEESGGESTRYAYDAAGNRVDRHAPQGREESEFDVGQRIVRSGAVTFRHDVHGNLIERTTASGTTRYVYDVQQKLVEVQLPDERRIRYGYAPTGERVWREDERGRTYFVSDGLHLVAELDSDLQPRSTYVFGAGIDQPLMMRQGDTERYFYQGLLGSVVGVADSSENVVARFAYDAFGSFQSTFVSPPVETGPFRFTGGIFDADTGLYYFRNRYYDPRLGRFLTPDPELGTLDDPCSWNPYLYAGNAPTKYTDRFGLAKDDSGDIIRRLFGSRRNPILTNELKGAVPSPEASAALRDAYNNAPRPGTPSAAEPSSGGLLSRLRSGLSEMRQALSNAWEGLKSHVSSSTEPRPGKVPTISGKGDETIRSSGPVKGRRPTRGNRGGFAVAPADLQSAAQRVATTASGTLATVGALLLPANLIARYCEGDGATGVVSELGGYAVSMVAVSTVLGAGVKATTLIVGAPAVAAIGGSTAAIVGGTVGLGYLVIQGVQATAERFGNVPGVVGERQLQALQQANLENLGAVASRYSQEVEALAGLKERIQAATAEIQSAAERAETAAGEATALLTQVQASAASLGAASARCDSAGGLRIEIAGHAEKAEQLEKAVGSRLDAADAQASTIQTKEQANAVLQVYRDAAAQVQAVASEAVDARAKNETLLEIIQEAGTARTARAAAQTAAATIASRTATANAAIAAGQAARAQVQTLTSQLKGRADELRRTIRRAETSLFPADHPRVRDEFSYIYRRLDILSTVAAPTEDALLQAGTQAAAAAPLAAQAAGILETINGLPLCEGLATADDAVARAEAAAQRARDRLAASAGHIESLANWLPGADLSQLIETPVPDLSDLVGTVTRSGQPPVAGEDQPDQQPDAPDLSDLEGLTERWDPGDIRPIDPIPPPSPPPSPSQGIVYATGGLDPQWLQQAIGGEAGVQITSTPVRLTIDRNGKAALSDTTLQVRLTGQGSAFLGSLTMKFAPTEVADGRVRGRYSGQGSGMLQWESQVERSRGGGAGTWSAVRQPNGSWRLIVVTPSTRPLNEVHYLLKPSLP